MTDTSAELAALEAAALAAIDEWRKALIEQGKQDAQDGEQRDEQRDEQEAEHAAAARVEQAVTALVEKALARTPIAAGDEVGFEASADEFVVAYQGADGSYSHIAARRYFAGTSDRARVYCYRGYDSFAAMLEAVRDGQADRGFLPIENTTAGSINDAYDLLAHMNLTLVGEQKHHVDHCLIALKEKPLAEIRHVYSHPQALAQCSRFLSNLRDCHVEAFLDTAMAVQKVKADGNPAQAAIASAEAAALYGLHVIQHSIANQRENYTRFVVVARQAAQWPLELPCKTSIIFATRHEEGALLRCLQLLADKHLNMTKLESRPRMGTPWEYLFYVDFEGNVAQPAVKEALQNLALEASFFKLLGSYPRG